jgi:hypothetical protein
MVADKEDRGRAVGVHDFTDRRIVGSEERRRRARLRWDWLHHRDMKVLSRALGRGKRASPSPARLSAVQLLGGMVILSGTALAKGERAFAD